MRGKEKSPSDGHCQCEKDGRPFPGVSIIFESVPVIRIAKERAAFLKINDFNDISFFGTSECYHCCSIM
jgi:hypothetical protein